MARKRIPTVNFKADMRKVREATSGLPAFDENPGRFRARIFWCDNSGRPSKRAVYFSLFILLALVYAVSCMTGIIKSFDRELGFFLLGCMGATGLNYYKKEAYEYTSGEYNPGGADQSNGL